jgi:hypothetical protein
MDDHVNGTLLRDIISLLSYHVVREPCRPSSVTSPTQTSDLVS